MTRHLQLGDMRLEVLLKDIKNIHLSVHPPTGRVRISAPSRMDIDSIRLFAISKISWIRKQQSRFRNQARETLRENIDRESHYVWGKRYLLRVLESSGPPGVELKHGKMLLRIRPGSDRARRRDVIDSWYREQIKQAIGPLLTRWTPRLGVKVQRVFVQKMKTKWGSCNPRKRNLRLNTELAKKSVECFEYIVMHEMIHLLEPTHNAHFVQLMDRYVPHWRHLRDELNRAPLGHETWEY